MSIPFSFSGSLNFPPDTGQPTLSIAIATSGQFDSAEGGQILKLTGAGTEVVELGTVPAEGLKALLVKVDAGASVLPVNLRFNGGGASGQVEVSPGGFFALGSPAPGTGITALSIVFASDVTVRVWALS